MTAVYCIVPKAAEPSLSRLGQDGAGRFVATLIPVG